MNKACIFDFDGVIIDNERHWEAAKKEMYLEVYGHEIAQKLNQTLGLNMDAIHDLALSHGTKAIAQSLYDACDRQAKHIYAEAPITEGVDKLVEQLIAMNFSLAIVSASPRSWIDIALQRLHNPKAFSVILSLHDRNDLAHKPDPAGYTEAMKLLEAHEKSTIIIEDSNTGIQSAKASGALTIGLRQNHIEGYVAKGADVYVDAIIDVVNITKTLGN